MRCASAARRVPVVGLSPAPSQRPPPAAQRRAEPLRCGPNPSLGGNRPKRVYGLVVLPRVSAVKRGWLWSATLSRGSSFESDVVRDMWNPVGEERENAGGNAAVALCEVVARQTMWQG